MEDTYYIVSDGSIMDIESFILYTLHLKKENKHFVFTEWFSKDDFSDIDIYNHLTKMLE